MAQVSLPFFLNAMFQSVHYVACFIFNGEILFFVCLFPHSDGLQIDGVTQYVVEMVKHSGVKV